MQKEEDKHSVRTSMLFVSYGIAPAGLARLPSLCRSVSIPHQLIIDNRASSPAPPTAAPDLQFIPGDNTAFEFSGWQKGIEAAKATPHQPDLFLMTNDTALTEKQSALPVFSQEILNRVAAASAMAGRVRHLPCKVTYNGLDLSTYIQTHFFILPREIVKKLGSVVTFNNADEFMYPEYRAMEGSEVHGFNGSEGCLSSQQSEIGNQKSATLSTPLPPFRPHEVWAHGFDKYLFQMLTQRWHNHGMPYTPEHYPFFRRKVLSVLNELMLTARVRALGYPIMDLTPLPWLFNSFALWNLPGRPIAPWQGIRNTVQYGLDLVFLNSAAQRLGLDQWLHHTIERDWKKGS